MQMFRRHNRTRLLLAAMAATLIAAAPAPAGERQPAFPGAQGAGRHAEGGRGGDVYIVTHLGDSGRGSLRHAVESADGPRTVVFHVAGTIELEDDLDIRKSRLTLAGQTAPGDGVTVAHRQTRVIDAEHVIIRYLRFRPGDARAAPEEYEPDSLEVINSHHVMIDHVSASWGIDEVLSVVKGSGDVTVQWSIIAEALNESKHHKGAHGYGSLLRTDGVVTFHHNLYAHNRSRNPRPGDGVRLDFVNNVIYNPGGRFGYAAADPLSMNYVGNYGIAGPDTASDNTSLFHSPTPSHRIYQRDNRIDLNRNGRIDGRDPGWDAFSGDFQRLDAPLDISALQAEPAETALENVLAHAGASRSRDAADRRVVEHVRTGTGSIIDSQDDVGGWPTLRTGQPPTDTDRDGMPDEWETQHGLDPHNPNDRNDPADDGYTQLERYLNCLVESR